MYDELKEKCRACSQGCVYPSECSYFDKPPLRCMRQLLSEAADAIEELLAERDEVNADSWKTAFEVERDEHRWIPVADRLPEQGDPLSICLVVGGAHDQLSWYELCDFAEGQFWLKDQINGGRVTHWMPLPEPSKEEK